MLGFDDEVWFSCVTLGLGCNTSLHRVTIPFILRIQLKNRKKNECVRTNLGNLRVNDSRECCEPCLVDVVKLLVVWHSV